MSIYSDLDDIFLQYPQTEIRDKVQQYIEEFILADLYKESYPAVGRLCDEKLDRSGALLGRVRDYARGIKN